MESLNGPPIRPIAEVVQEHVEATIAAYGEKVPQWRIAVELGISPTTLIRMKRKWQNGETLVRDRR